MFRNLVPRTASSVLVRPTARLFSVSTAAAEAAHGVKRLGVIGAGQMVLTL
jgi:hypothetical protein